VADDVARGAGRVPGAVADDVALGAGRARLGGMADDVARGAPGRMPVAGLADEGALALADDVARAGSGSHKTLEEALVEAGVDLALELVPLGPEESPTVDAVPMPRQPRSLSINASYAGHPGVVALARTPALDAVPSNLRVTIASSTDPAGLLERTRSRSRLDTPLTILGRSDHDRDALVLPSTGAPVRIVDILRGCEEQRAPCLVMACGPLAPPECDDAIASIWKSAAASLPGVSASESDAVFADPLRARIQLTRGLHEARSADARASGSFIARLQRTAEGWSMVVASGRP